MCDCRLNLGAKDSPFNVIYKHSSLDIKISLVFVNMNASINPESQDLWNFLNFVKFPGILEVKMDWCTVYFSCIYVYLFFHAVHHYKSYIL